MTKDTIVVSFNKEWKRLRVDIREFKNIWHNGLLVKAFIEYRACISDVYRQAGEVLVSPPDIDDNFKVSMGEIPQEYFSLRKNIFSTLFQSIYQLLQVKKDRRVLYGKLNHLFRIWVTAADNLLDNEDKIVMPIVIPGRSRVMRQVISVMAADRVLKRLLDEAVDKDIISSGDSRILSDLSLQVLLPSAAEEASEEEGILERPDPEYVLYTIHRLKTGLLFHVPFLGPEHVEADIDRNIFNKCKDSLDKFGLGCQLLDDIRDMARDHKEKRHNYILSKICCEGGISDIDRLNGLEEGIVASSKIYQYFPEFVEPTAGLAKDLLKDGLFSLDEAGLGVGKYAANKMVSSMFDLLDIGELKECSKEQKISV